MTPVATGIPRSTTYPLRRRHVQPREDCHTNALLREDEGMPRSLPCLLLIGCIDATPDIPGSPTGPGEGEASWDPSVPGPADLSPPTPIPLLPAAPPEEPPWGQDLLLDSSFEGAFGPSWQVTAGTCGLADGTGLYGPRSGSQAWWGGHDHCQTAQRVDLAERGFPGTEVDGGDIGFQLSGWLKNGSPPGDFESRDFDDQVILRLEALDDSETVLHSWETLGAGDETWIAREVRGLLPKRTRGVTVTVAGTWRRGEVHDSLAEDLALVFLREDPVTPSLTKGPMLTEARTNGTTVLWETDRAWARNSLQWWTEGEEQTALVTTTQVDPERHVHRATLQGLTAETDVTYQIGHGEQRTEAATFSTLPEPGSEVRIGWFADNQLGPDQLATHLDQMAPEDPHLVVAVGDIVQEGWRLSDWDQLWFEPLDASGLFTTRPVVVVRGNHDGEYPEAYAYTHVPGDNGAWFAQTVGDLFLVVLDSEAPTDGEQLAFLEEALASDEAQDAAWSAVTFHRTAWSNTRDLAWGHHLDTARTDWEPVFEAHGVDLVITGHHHSYQRGTQNGVTYLVVGGAGNFLDSGHWDQFDWIEVEAIVHHHGMLTVTPDELVWTALLDDGHELDRFVLSAE